MSRPSFLRAGFLGVGAVAVAGALAIAWSSVTACNSLSDVSPLPDVDASSDFDGGFVPPLEDAAPTPSTSVDAGTFASARVRLAHLLQGVDAVDLCARLDPPTAGPWEPRKITANPDGEKPEGLKFGEVSRHFVLPVPTAAGARYVFKVVAVGQPCEGDGGAGLVNIPVQTLRQTGGLTLVATGRSIGEDAGDANPRGAALTDTVAPSQAFSLFRVFHGVPDMAAFDVVINGETVLTGIRFGSAIGHPYSTTNTTGFANIAAGVPANSTLTLRAGTTVRSFVIPERLRRGIASTVFVSGSLRGDDPITATLCSDRTQPVGETTATCTKLDEAPQ
jgi:hypothetical protein